MNIKISLEIEFYLINSNIHDIENKIKEKLSFTFAITPEYEKGQYEICSNPLTFKESIQFIEELQEILFFIDDVYAFPFITDKLAPNGLHINFISNTFHDTQYVYSLADYLCEQLDKNDLTNILRVANLKFIKYQYYKDTILKLANQRFLSECVYVPKSLSFSNRFNRTTAIRLIKDDLKNFRIEFRLGYLYCDYGYLLKFLFKSINNFKNIKTDFNYLSYSCKHKKFFKL